MTSELLLVFFRLIRLGHPQNFLNYISFDANQPAGPGFYKDNIKVFHIYRYNPESGENPSDIVAH